MGVFFQFRTPSGHMCVDLLYVTIADGDAQCNLVTDADQVADVADDLPG